MTTNLDIESDITALEFVYDQLSALSTTLYIHLHVEEYEGIEQLLMSAQDAIDMALDARLPKRF